MQGRETQPLAQAADVLKHRGLNHEDGGDGGMVDGDGIARCPVNAEAVACVALQEHLEVARSGVSTRSDLEDPSPPRRCAG